MPCVWIERGDLAITVNGENVLLDASGAAFVTAHSTLIFADLHFEKGSSYARGRQFLPPYDTASTLLRMAQTIARHNPAHVIALGDSFHDAGAAERLDPQQRDQLRLLGRTARLTWISGNHDPQLPGWLEGEVAGHLHPCARVSKWGRSVRRRCFVSDGLRLILPSFGAYTGGLDVGDAAIGSLFASGFHAYMLGSARVYAIPRRVAV